MPISVKQAREILGKSAGDINETQIRELVNIFTILSDFAIDSYLAKVSSRTAKENNTR